MKKVLALVLAVIMVCTMAMAVEIGTATEATTPNYDSNNQHLGHVLPGKSIIFTRSDLNVPDSAKTADVKVAIAFEKGADLIASQGWVKTSGGDKYVVTTKASETAGRDGKADIIISTIKVTQTGVKNPLLDAKFTKVKDGKTLYASSTNISMENTAGFNEMDTILNDVNGLFMCLGFDYGYPTDTIVIEKGMTSLGALAEDTLYTVKTTSDVNTKVNSVEINVATGNFTVVYTLKVGEKLLFTELTALTGKPEEKFNKNVVDNDATVVETLVGVTVPNKAVSLYVNSQKDGAKMYVLNADGTATTLNAAFDSNKVLTATAKVAGPVVVTDKAITASSATTEPGNTTNPGTGANDVVGVAAALAVVALVSGAAISLKK